MVITTKASVATDFLVSARGSVTARIRATATGPIVTGICSWLEAHPAAKQWLWFAGLWASGLLTVTILTYPIKYLMRQLG